MLAILFDSGVATAALLAISLNLVWPKPPPRVIVVEATSNMRGSTRIKTFATDDGGQAGADMLPPPLATPSPVDVEPAPEPVTSL